jgi:polar amino acid transport system substrate-binding protein
LIEAFVTEKLEAAAGVRQALETYAKTHPEVMVMQDKFMEIRQAMGVPKGRTAGAKYLSAFVEGMKTSGFVADALKRSNQSATVAPPAK